MASEAAMADRHTYLLSRSTMAARSNKSFNMLSLIISSVCATIVDDKVDDGAVTPRT